MERLSDLVLNVRGWLRRLHLWWCKQRGHVITHPVAMSYRVQATRLEDGRVIDGELIEVRGTQCITCHPTP